MSTLTSIFRADKHPYTHSTTSWIIPNRPDGAYGKLIHYLSGGGMQTFGRTIAQEESRRKHLRFYRVALCFGVVWILFYFI